jgi:hypothetical protein
LDGFRQHVRRSQRKFLNVPARISFDQFLIQKAQPNGRRQPVIMRLVRNLDCG